MTMLRNLLVGAVAGLLVAAAPVFGADGPATHRAPGQHPMAGPIMERLEHEATVLHKALAELGLSDEQKAQVKELFENFKKKVEEFRDAHKAEIEKIRADMKAAREAKDKAAMEKVREEIKKLLEDAPKPREIIEGLKNILTEQQKQELREKLKAIREQAQERRAAHEGAASRPAK